MNDIVNSYSVNGQPLQRTRVENWNEFQSIIHTGDVTHGTVRYHETERFVNDHTLNFYRYNGTNRVSDVGASGRHNNELKDVIDEDNFRYFEYYD